MSDCKVYAHIGFKTEKESEKNQNPSKVDEDGTQSFRKRTKTFSLKTEGMKKKEKRKKKCEKVCSFNGR